MPSYAIPSRLPDNSHFDIHASSCNCRWDDPPMHCPVHDSDLLYLDQFGARAQASRSRPLHASTRSSRIYKPQRLPETALSIDLRSAYPVSRINYVAAPALAIQKSDPLAMVSSDSIPASQDPIMSSSGSWSRSLSPSLLQSTSLSRSSYQPAPPPHPSFSASPSTRYEPPRRASERTPTFELPGPIEPQARWWEYPGVLPEPKHEPGHRNQRFVPRPILKKGYSCVCASHPSLPLYIAEQCNILVRLT